MSGIALCTDSSALFPAGVAERLGVIVVPMAITLDDDPFEEDERALDAFYARLAEGARVTTSQPSPGEFLDAYTVAAQTGSNEVLSFHLDARTSGTTRSAEFAALEAPIPVTVVDTETVSFGVGLCVRAAAHALAGGASASQAAEAAHVMSRKLRNVFVALSGTPGRLPKQTGWSLLEFTEGAIVPRAACVGLEHAVEAMSAQVVEEEGPLRAAVGHAGAPTAGAADALALSLENQAQLVSVERYRVGAAVGAHTGPLSLGVFWWGASEQVLRERGGTRESNRDLRRDSTASTGTVGSRPE